MGSAKQSVSSNTKQADRFVKVLVAAAGDVDEDRLVAGAFGGELHGVGDGVGGLEGGEDALGFGHGGEGLERVGVGAGGVGRALGVVPVGVLGADAGVVEAGRAGVDAHGLAVVVLEDVGAGAVQDAGRAEGERGGVVAEVDRSSAGLDAVELNAIIGEEGEEDPRGVGPAADAGDDVVGELSELGEELGAGLGADDRLEVADDHGEGVRPDDGSDDVVRVVGGLHPVAHGGVGGVLERARAGLDGDDLGPHELHPLDVGALASHVLGAHEDLALEAQPGAGGGGGDAVLPRAGLGDDAGLAHADREQPWPSELLIL